MASPELIVVGSVALDTVTSPAGSVTEALGGSATYFSAAAAILARVGMVAVVGEDFPAEHLTTLSERGVALDGLETAPGRTFRWKGAYEEDLNLAITYDTQLNVFETFEPKLPALWSDTPFVFLANIDPRLQLQVLDMVPGTAFVGADTMNFWIEGKREELSRVIARVDCLTMNDAEIRQFSGEENLLAAIDATAGLGPEYIIVKRGEYGAMLWHAGDLFLLPAWPLGRVTDPTGAGDTFAGGFFGYLASQGEVSPTTVRHGLVLGTVLASFTVEGFSLTGLLAVTPAALARRVTEFGAMTAVTGTGPVLPAP